MTESQSLGILILAMPIVGAVCLGFAYGVLVAAGIWCMVMALMISIIAGAHGIKKQLQMTNDD